MSTFTRDADPVSVPCCGINHSDRGTSGHCDSCGVAVAKRDDGKVFDIQLRGSYNARKMACWGGTHRCDPERIVAHQAQRELLIERGVIVKGLVVEVFKGRKVPVGTVGMVRWIGTDSFGGQRVGLVVDGTDGLVYTALTNVRRVAS